MMFCSFQSSLESCLWIHREIWLLSTEENRHMGGLKQGMLREIESAHNHVKRLQDFLATLYVACKLSHTPNLLQLYGGIISDQLKHGFIEGQRLLNLKF